MDGTRTSLSCAELPPSVCWWPLFAGVVGAPPAGAGVAASAGAGVGAAGGTAAIGALGRSCVLCVCVGCDVHTHICTCTRGTHMRQPRDPLFYS